MTARLLLSYGNVDRGETRALGKERHWNETAKRRSVDSSHAGHTQPRPTHITTRSLTLAPGKERHTRRNADQCPPRERVRGLQPRRTQLNLSEYSHLQPLANQLPAACLRHTKVPTPLAWNLDGGSTKKKYPVLGTRYFFCQWKRK